MLGNQIDDDKYKRAVSFNEGFDSTFTMFEKYLVNVEFKEISALNK